MKRSDRMHHQYKQQASEPRYNTYYQPVGQPPRKQKSKRIFRTIIFTILLLCLLFVGMMYVLSRQADVEELSSIEDKTTYVPSNSMPDYTKGAFIAVEDRRFYDHHGVDIKGSLRAIFSTVKNRDNLQGGSTITQQLVKNYYYDNQQTVTRKLKEIFVAYRVEREYDKAHILSYYLNNIYYGDDQYTIESAANYYFGSTVDTTNPNLSQITVLQSAILASKVNAPSAYQINDMSPSFINRTKMTLEKMKQQNYIDESQYNEALQQLGA
ncbi:monofunctional peptidoglycan glycosyltransferase SgtB [Staphylococcus sp. 11261D007BR]